MRIFIGWDSRFPEPALVLAHSIRKHTSVPVSIRFLDYRHLTDCYGFNREYDPKATTEFTYSRFLIPYLCGYHGSATFMDNDMLCLSDISQIRTHAPFLVAARMPYGAYHKTREVWLKVRKHEQKAVDGSIKMHGVVQTAYPRKNWSSFMQMDCSALTLWTKDVVERQTGAYLHQFQDIPDDKISEVPDGWNDLEDQYRPKETKLLHWTEGGPWNDPDKKWPHQDLWLEARREWLISEGRDPKTPLPRPPV